MTRPTFIQWIWAFWLWKISPRELRHCLSIIDRHDLSISYDQLVAHKLAGGRITSWVEGLAYARESGIPLDVMNAAARDLLGAFGSKITLTEHIRIAQSRGFRDMQRVPFDSLQKKNA
jgi:uncharacterized protein YqfA (UPF0365 family)